MNTNLFTIHLTYDKWLAVKSSYNVKVIKGDTYKGNNTTCVSSMSLVCIQSPDDAELLFWTGEDAAIVAKVVFKGDAAAVVETIDKYFSPQKLKMLNCIKTRQQWDAAIASIKPSSKVILQSVVMKITAWKGKLSVYFEATTNVANPIASLYFKAARKNVGDDKTFTRLLQKYQKHAPQRSTTTYNAMHFNHTQIPGVRKYEWDIMTKGMKSIVKATKS